jgi:hypothetical protein
MKSVASSRDSLPALFNLLLASLVSSFAIFSVPQIAAAATLETLHIFCARDSQCPDGQFPLASLTQDAQGNLFGTTAEGGAHGWGTVFELQRVRGGYKYQRLHSFCFRTFCTDGQEPLAKVIVDVSGNLYGATQNGGSRASGGEVFKLVPDASRTRWQFVKLHEFCRRSDCSDGRKNGYNPKTGLTYRGAETGALYDGISPLFGTTNLGGTVGGTFGVTNGTVYELDAVPGSQERIKKVLYRFCSRSDCSDGINPNRDLVFDTHGNLYGTTPDGRGGSGAGKGVVFELSPVHGGYKETTLYRFCRRKNCIDGRQPNGPVIQDGQGNLIGTTATGGTDGGGVIFKIMHNDTSSQETVVYNFCLSCASGSPTAGVVMDSNGDFFGMAGLASVYRVTAGAETVLANFCPTQDCDIGQGGLLLDKAGHLFGTSAGDGDPQGSSPSLVFEVTP